MKEQSPCGEGDTCVLNTRISKARKTAIEVGCREGEGNGILACKVFVSLSVLFVVVKLHFPKTALCHTHFADPDILSKHYGACSVQFRRATKVATRPPGNAGELPFQPLSRGLARFIRLLQREQV